MVMVGTQFCTDTMGIHKLAGDARILGQDFIGCGECVERTQCDIAQIADRRGDDVETGLKLRAVVLPAPVTSTSLASMSLGRGTAVCRNGRIFG